MKINPIELRYSELANSDCCLSCGGAVNYANVQKGDVCIDLGSGRGTEAIRLAEEVGEHGFVYGIDITDEMLKKATKTAEKLNVTNVKFVKSDLEKIDLPSNIANIIISNCTINHASDKQQVWNEIYRLLKDNGRFIVSDIYAITEIPDIYKNDPVAVSECWAGAIVKDEYLKILNLAGLTNITILEESKPYEKGKAEVVSFTISGYKNKKKCC